MASVAMLAGCGTINSLAVKSVASTLAEGGDTVTSHNDPELVADALPFTLMLHESLLSSVPKYEPLLTTTCSLFAQYSFGFIAADAEALQRDDYDRSKELSDRAFKLAERGKNYCWRGLEVKFHGISEALKANPTGALAKAKKEHVELLYWSAASLGAAISAGGLDHPELLIDWPIVRALVERALALDETWSNGSLPELMITVESQGEAFGGSEERARRYFARAVEIQRGLSPVPYVALATGVVKSNQDRGEFTKLIEQAIAIDPDKDPTHRLVTLVYQKRAKLLLERVDDLFLEPSPTSK
ncbi:MAG: TRAP transporter TatT component family protein [Vicinamibacterales bacterium]|nr:TRAP transporter TatT component family protein [Vicinamibacterales bacterium]